ncbi:MAG: glucose 1-dehydrogenase [Deltaproteobacteria bacterium]|nr:glucose 1-dehydrogenase [Deltaproteobacteria bacterium]
MTQIDFRLDGRVALITGGSRGIGEAIARVYASAGAKVVIASRYMENLKPVAESITAEGGDITPIVCHMGYTEQIRELTGKTLEKYGTIDILVNNAATNPFFGNMVDAEEKAWDKTVDVNLKGYFIMAQEAAKVMMKNGGGNIINISSIAGMSPPPMQGIYAITKAGVISMTKAFAKELGPHGIRVNAIAPGLTDTKFASVLIQTKEILEVALQGIPLNRYAAPMEMAGAALFLASDASAFVNGAILTIDGGAVV